MNPWDQFTGANAGYVQELYERYQQDPGAVDEATRQAFARWAPPVEDGVVEPASAPTWPAGGTDLKAGIAAFTLAESIRRFGHLAARTDPLGLREPVGDPSLHPQAHGLTEEILRRLPADIAGGPAAAGAADAWEAIERLRAVYCGSTGHDYNQVFVPEEREWLRRAVESGRFRPPHDPVDGRELLDRITQVESFERFLHRTFPGKTRFSIEGLDLMIPILDEIIHDAAAGGVKHVMIAMAHRGRLNVLAHILQKPYAQILAEFKDPLLPRSWAEDLGWMGDVKYHAGARVERRDDLPETVVVSMPPNPSHLEAVDPVLAGMARAAATDVDQPGPPRFRKEQVLAILIHGDSAFPGQGVVAETLNLARLEGYDVGGIIHIIANNQLGFTAEPEESYSTSYASGMARGFKIPIAHVNADDPAACIEAARLAWAYRHRFGLDFLIDLVGYRRYGHNEGDEPAFTQPRTYQVIAAHPTVRELYARQLDERGQVSAADADAMVQEHFSAMEKAYAGLKPEQDFVPPLPEVPPRGAARRAQTAVPLDRLAALNAELTRVPEGFTVHRKLERGRERRKAIFESPGERTVDWAAAEELAFASILQDGVAIRLTGEDVERGTFSHRHAVYHDAVTGAEHVPLQAIPSARAAFEIHNSPLTENATIGFEFGYNIQEPDRLVLWEGQYGDFINGAQVVLDEFLTSGRAKWGLAPSLVLLLPHGYEGQGPDHSSARLERFLNAAADTNMRIANCTTAAQYFHLLRRQAGLLETDPLPLIVMTPKSLLRHPATASSPAELAQGRFQLVIDDETVKQPAKVRRLVLCSGKIHVDLATSEARKDVTSVALARVEQLYPFPADEIRAVLDRYPKLRDVCWVQEEPENMGAWEFVRPLLEQLIDGRWPLRYIGRVRNSSPSEGSSTWHAANQRAIVAQVFEQKADVGEADRVLSKQV
ncbi:MAG: 2-oxoglutarate dehydrogenase E1 component [Vicinamibacterales bacterium]